MRKWVGEGREECGTRTLVCCGHGGLKAAGMGVSVWVASAIDSPRRSPVCVRTAARSALERSTYACVRGQPGPSGMTTQTVPSWP
eukprot:COSAG03_NODE_894_length_5464_cov_8.128984_11_plen_85_part_00